MKIKSKIYFIETFMFRLIEKSVQNKCNRRDHSNLTTHRPHKIDLVLLTKTGTSTKMRNVIHCKT